MKFSCGKCQTGYSVPDDKIRGRRVRISCRRCGAPIVVEGPRSAPPAPLPVRSEMKTVLGIAPDELATPGAGVPKAPSPEPVWSVATNPKAPAKMTAEAIVSAYVAGTVTLATRVWKKGMPEWQPLSKVSTLVAALRVRGVELPPGSEPRSEFDDENEATAVLDVEKARAMTTRSPHADIKAPEGLTPRRAARKEPPPKQGGQAPSQRAAGPAPAAAAPGFGDDEATAVIDPDRARSLLTGEGEPGSEPGSPDEGGRPPGFDDEDDVTRVATAEAARELLRASVDDEPRKDSNEPSVVVEGTAKDSTKGQDAPATRASRSERPRPPDAPRVHPVHLAIQNEPTRIVRFKAKKSRTPLWVGFLIVAIASAAGGLLASRYFGPAPPASAPK